MSLIRNTTDEITTDDFYIQNIQTVTNLYHIYLHESIGDVIKYVKLIHLLRNLDEKDTALIFLNNCGGSVATGIEIINAMKAAHGKVFTCISGPVYSMASLLALQGQKIYVEPDSFMMLHDYSGSESGKGSEVIAAVKNNHKFYTNLVRSWTKGFLTSKELTDIMSGSDMYLDSEEIMKRLRKMNKLMNKDSKKG